MTIFPGTLDNLGIEISAERTLTADEFSGLSAGRAKRLCFWGTVRYRDAFDPNDKYNTPQLATGLTYNVDAQRSISAKIMRNWREGAPSSAGVSLGLRQKF